MATLSQTKIKVDRLELIKKLEGALGKNGARYKRQMVSHERTKLAAAKEIQTQARALTVDPERFKDTYRKSRVSVNLTSKVEVVPRPKDHDCDLRNTITVLKLSNEASVAISAQQYEQFFPCDAG